LSTFIQKRYLELRRVFACKTQQFYQNAKKTYSISHKRNYHAVWQIERY